MNEGESCGPLPLPGLSQDLTQGKLTQAKCEHECIGLCVAQLCSQLSWLL